MMKPPTRREEGVIFRIGSVAGILGSLLAMVGNLLHPATPIGDPQGVARTIAQSESWVLVHLVIVVGLILMLGALVALCRSIEGGVPGALAQLAYVAAVSGVTVGVVLVIVDGVAAKHLADAWEAAPPEGAAAALQVVLAEEAINFALAALFNILFAGVTFILLGSRWPGAVSTPDGWGGWLWSPVSARCRSAWYRRTRENPSGLPGSPPSSFPRSSRCGWPG